MEWVKRWDGSNCHEGAVRSRLTEGFCDVSDIKLVVPSGRREGDGERVKVTGVVGVDFGKWKIMPRISFKQVFLYLLPSFLS